MEKGKQNYLRYNILIANDIVKLNELRLMRNIKSPIMLKIPAYAFRTLDSKSQAQVSYQEDLKEIFRE